MSRIARWGRQRGVSQGEQLAFRRKRRGARKRGGERTGEVAEDDGLLGDLYSRVSFSEDIGDELANVEEDGDNVPGKDHLGGRISGGNPREITNGLAANRHPNDSRE